MHARLRRDPGGTMEHERYRIGQLADELGINPKTIRYYEELGLLAPVARNAAGYRQYTGREREALRFVITAKASGLTLAEIGDILALRRAGEEPCTHVRRMLDRKLAAVEERLRALSVFREELLALRDAAASPCDGRVCGIIERHASRPHADGVPAV
jgi:DNA-binding transcriptional MerR regulator